MQILFIIPFLIWAAIEDLRACIIPDRIPLIGIPIGLGASILNHNALDSLGGLLIGFGLMFACAELGDRLCGHETIGGGDIKLMAMIGSFLGTIKTLEVFIIASAFGLLWFIGANMRRNHAQVPYGPFLLLATLASFIHV